METLLISPAYRSEIVVGKFLTVMAASAATALLNLASMGLTMAVLGRQFAGNLGPDAANGPAPGSPLDELAPPSLAALAWIVVLLIPLSAFFSAALQAPRAGTMAMQSTGQGGTHSAQPMHQSSTTVCMSRAAPTIASTGQASMHSVQPMQRLSSIRAAPALFTGESMPFPYHARGAGA